MDLFVGTGDLRLPAMPCNSASLLQAKLHGSPIRRSAEIKLIPRFICMDGFSISIQASEIHRSVPQRRDGPYSHVECAYPSSPVQALIPFLLEEAGVSLEQSVYHRVPVEIVQYILNSHGGMRV